MLDIFRKEVDGGVLWVGAAKDENKPENVQGVSRGEPRSIFYLRRENANQAHNRAGRVRRRGSDLTTKATAHVRAVIQQIDGTKLQVDVVGLDLTALIDTRQVVE